MTKRKGYDDASSLGKSTLVPYRKGEDPMHRHDRRLAANLNWKHELMRWARENGFRIDIKNEGHHWILANPSVRVEWWPSSGKLVIDQKWDNGIHCHDYKQLISFLEKKSISTKEEQQE